jgi:RimJ/RimL family protein N-acetyltransferase
MHFRRVTSQDLPLLIEWATDERYDEFFRRIPPVCEWAHPALVESSFANFYVMMKDGRELGLASMGVEDPYAKVFKVGGLLTAGHTMDESKLMLDYMVDIAFNKLSMNKIITVILAHRHKLHERFLGYGFKLEGLFRESALHRGKLVDEHQYALRREEWQGFSNSQQPGSN